MFDNLKDLFVFGWSVLNAHQHNEPLIYINGRYLFFSSLLFIFFFTRNKHDSLCLVCICMRIFFSLFFGGIVRRNDLWNWTNNTHTATTKNESVCFHILQSIGRKSAYLKRFVYIYYVSSVQGLRMAVAQYINTTYFSFVFIFPLILPFNCTQFFMLFSWGSHKYLRFHNFLERYDTNTTQSRRMNDRMKQRMLCVHFECVRTTFKMFYK